MNIVDILQCDRQAAEGKPEVEFERARRVGVEMPPDEE